MRAYSTREVAELVGESQQRVRAAARAGFVAPLKNPRGHFRFSFQDLVLLRSTKALEQQNLGVRRTWRALRAVRALLPASRPLSSVRVVAAADRVFVRENNTAWDPESGQTLFDFALDNAERSPASSSGHPAAGKIVSTDTADYWFERGLRLDRAEAHENAAAAYRRALELDSGHFNARINLGRLLHTARDYRAAESLYREALQLHPNHSVAVFNLGVVLEDQGDLREAISCYQQAVLADPDLPDAHYNLARLHEFRGEQMLAARHMSRFRALTRDEI
ncbi:MAG: tetratricopeptide repeat protein [Gammaproteobacteria bacterium]|nr:tetratricopeptide repeat protein [Gammaproteobacteria bacterium]MDH3505676.1 tetratricopeptide repeat protein [Gammaproteobacteria bacterium]